MKKVQVKIPDWVARMMGVRGTGSLVLERELVEGATIGSLLADLAREYPAFKRAVFSAEAGTVSEQLVFVLNGVLLQYPDVTAVQLGDGDEIDLLPQFAGG